MLLAAQTEGQVTADIKVATIERRIAKRERMAAFGFLGDFAQSRAFNFGRGACEISLDEIA